MAASQLLFSDHARFNRLRHILTWLAATIAVVVAVAIPVIYLLTAHKYETLRVERTARDLAESVSTFVYSHPDLWEFSTNRLERLLLAHGGEEQLRQLIGPNGDIIVASQSTLEDGVFQIPYRLSFEGNAKIFNGQIVIGTIRVSESLSPVLVATGWIAVFGSLLAAAVFAILRALPLRALDNAMNHLQAAHADLRNRVSRHEKTQAALTESEERFRSVVNNSPTKIHIKDLDGRYLLINSKAERLFGVTEQEAKGKTTHEIFPNRQADDFRLHDRAVLESGQTIEQEEEWPRGDGIHTFLTVKFPILDSTGKVTAIGAIGTDITERKRIEEALRESRDQVQLITDNLPAGICYYDSEQRYRFINRTLEEWYDRPVEEVLGRTTGDILGKKAQDQIGPKLDATLRGNVQNSEHVVTHPDGNTRAVYVEYVPHFDETKKVQGCFALIHDITERRQAEEALLASEKALQERIADLEKAQHKLEMQGESLVRLADDLLIARDEARAADRAKSEFLAAMSHELRTPMNAVLGFSEIMKDETLGPVGNPKYREYADDIYASGKHLLGLINDILDLSKIESGTDKLHEDRIEIPEIIHSALKLVEQRAKQGAIKLQVEIADQLPALRADERKLKQILVNLLSNAVKFSEPGGEVAIWVWCRPDRGHVFQIIDTGIGITPEDIPKALSRFGQVDADLNRQYEGTGLGLPLTKALVELHGGTLDLQSHVGVGTIITVLFPADRIVGSLLETEAVDEADRKAG
jgi:PAS domain S-box-containing protein